MASAGNMHPFATRPISLDRQSIEIEGPERIHVSPQCDYEEKNYFIQKLYDDVTTAYEGFLRGERVSNDGKCLGWRPSGTEPYQWLKFSEVRTKAQCFGSALLEKGFSASSDSKIGIFSQNRPEWMIADLGCMTFSMVTVPLYSTLGPEGRNHTINLTNMELIVVDTLQKVNELLNQSETLTTLKRIVVMETPIPEEVKGRAEKAGMELLVYDELLAFGEANLKDPSPGKPDDLALIRFTSGTTGMPKGAMITHANIVANSAAIVAGLNNTYSFQPGSIAISFLPLAHAYEHTLQMILMMQGGASGFFRGELTELLDDMQALKPTVFTCVPRLANRLYDKIMGGVQSASVLKRMVFNFAYNRKKAETDVGIVRKDTWSDYFVFHKMQAILGGTVKVIITGSAPISPEVLEFLRVVFGCPVSEGYGQTETTCAISLTVPGEVQGGHVGAAVPSNMVKLVDVPEMGYLAADNRGEVCSKGPSAFQGYYKDPAKTAEAIDSDGWIHTGDIGMWLPNGALKLIDRKKHIYKLSQGEYIAPEKIENVLTRSLYVAQAFVYGDSLKSSNVAIIVPDDETIQRFSEGHGLSGTSREDICKNEAFHEAVRDDMEKLSSTAELCGFEKIKEFLLHPEPFSIENNLLTPTLKNKRATLKDHFQSHIDELYANLN